MNKSNIEEDANSKIMPEQLMNMNDSARNQNPLNDHLSRSLAIKSNLSQNVPKNVTKRSNLLNTHHQ